MKNNKQKIIVAMVLIIVCFAVLLPAAVKADPPIEKVGVLFVSAGETTNYDPRFSVGYYEHLFPVWPPGFMAGRPGWEGEDKDCYSLIHFADEAEAVICDVAEGTPIDIFCDARPEYDVAESGPSDLFVHGMGRHSTLGFPFNGDDTFRTDCFDDGISDDPAILFTLFGSATDNPYGTRPFDTDNLGPHVDDLDGPGIGIADFTESRAFNRMQTHYYIFNALGYKDPYDGQVKEWYYGAGGTTNIQAELLAAVQGDPMIHPDSEVVFRHSSEAFVENKDVYGQDHDYADSVETAFDELINDEAVDRIIVFSLSSAYTNVINYGPFWRDKYGNGVSAVPGKTYQECVEDITDGYGPETEADRDQLISDKPWDMYKVIMQETKDINDGRVPLSYTEDYGTSLHYDQAMLAMLEYTIAKYSILDTASLKVVLSTHGSSGGYLDGGECDVYFRTAEETTNRVINSIQSSFSWNGKLAIVPGPVEFAQPGEGANHDPPSPGKPFGDILSAGEQVDMAIKGKYINELGEITDNGLVDNATNEVFDYVIVIPNTFDAESSDTLGHARTDILGNLESITIEGTIDTWGRQEVDQNGLEYGDPAGTSPHYPFHDSENFTVRVMDASGWCTDTDNATPITVCKGADIDPTTVILSGAVLSYPDGTARQEITSAAVEVIIDAMKSENPPAIIQAPYSSKDLNTLSTDPAAPTAMPENMNIIWEYYDDQASCIGMTHQWQYREAGTTDPMTLITLVQVPMGPWATEGNYYLQWVWTTQVGNLGAGTYEMQAIVTDCAEQSVTSDSYYFTVEGDTDGDGIRDSEDNCPDNCNIGQLDADGDTIGDVCDPSPGCGGCGQDVCEEEC